MRTKYFQGFVLKTNIFNTTGWHLNPIQNNNTRNFTLSCQVLILNKFEKVFNSFINSVIDFLSVR